MRHWKWNAATSATACALASLALPSQVSAKEGVELGVSAGFKAATNPFLSAGDNTSSAAVQIDVNPSVYTENETSRFAIEGGLRYNYWFSHYNSDLAGDLSLRASKELSERTSAYAYGTVRSSRRSYDDYYLSNDLPIVEPDLPDPTIPIDVTSTGNHSRVTTFVAGTGLSHALSPNDSISFYAGYSHNLYESNSGTDYRSISLGAGYSRKLDTRTSLEFNGNFGFSNFLGVDVGDGTYTSGTVGIRRQLSPSSTASLRGGVAVSNVNNDLGQKDSKAYFIVSGDYCRQMLNGRTCLTASREVRPTSFGSVSDVNSFDLGWSRQIGQDDYISVNVGYTQTNGIIGPNISEGNRVTEIGGVSAHYSRRLKERLDLVVTGNATKVFDDVLSRDMNFQASVALRLRLG